jgi:hypothetical protein
MKSTIKGALVAFAVSALGAFTLMSASPASAGALTVWGRTCWASGGGTICPFQGGTTTAQVYTVYYDFVSTGTNKLIISEFYRLSYNGTLRSSSTNGRYDAGFHETVNNVANLNATASIWDYVYAAVVGEAGSGMNVASNIHGMGLLY